MYDDAQISKARELIQQCIELVQLEEQRSFLLMRLEMDLEAALAALEAVQTVRIAPFAKGLEHVQVLMPALRDAHNRAVYEEPLPSLTDDGEPNEYEVNE